MAINKNSNGKVRLRRWHPEDYAQRGGRRLVLPASAVRARDDEEGSPPAGSWTARAAKFLRADTFQLPDSLSRRRPREPAGDKDPKQRLRGAGSPARQQGDAEPQAAARPRRRRASAQSPLRRPRGAAGEAGAASMGAGAAQGPGASAGAPALDSGRCSDAATQKGQAAPAAPNGSLGAPENGPRGECDGSGGCAQAAAAPKASDAAEGAGAGAGGATLKTLQGRVGSRGPGGAHKHWTPASWWRGQVGGTAWEDYKVRAERLLPGSCPLLVFVNTRSGPQAGAALRRRFLRLLNPLQVRHKRPFTASVAHCFRGLCICPPRLPRHGIAAGQSVLGKLHGRFSAQYNCLASLQLADWW